MTRLYGFDENGVRRIVQTVRRIEAMPDSTVGNSGPTIGRGPTETQILGVNNTGGTLPPYSVVQVNAGSVYGSNYYASFVTPTGPLNPCVLTGSASCASGKVTTGFFGVGIGRYTGTAPTVGNSYGPNGSTSLAKDYFGFRCLGVGGGNLAWWCRELPTCFLCKMTATTGSIAKGSSGSVTLYLGTEVSTGVTFTAKALGAAVTANKWCIMQILGSNAIVAPYEC